LSALASELGIEGRNFIELLETADVDAHHYPNLLTGLFERFSDLKESGDLEAYREAIVEELKTLGLPEEFIEELEEAL
jgi:hypothetical protein